MVENDDSILHLSIPFLPIYPAIGYGSTAIAVVGSTSDPLQAPRIYPTGLGFMAC